MRAFLPFLLVCLWLAGCAGPAPRAPAAAPPLILVSLDGLRADYLERGVTPALRRFAREGVQAEAMRPSYPSLTFPNHYTIVTGLRPDRHGIVDNAMRDPQLGAFAMHDRTAVGDGRWWGGEPIWVTAERAGLRVAAMFWPGTEADILGVRPHWWQAFSYDVPAEARVARVLEWMRLPPAERPRLITLYFEHVDRAGHDHGPDSPQLLEALRLVDAQVAALLAGLARIGVPANVVIVSDHGMAAVSPRRIVFVDDLVALADVELWDTGASLLLAAKPGREAAAEQRLLGRHGHIECWRKGELPQRWHYGTHARIAPIVCQLDVGWHALTRAQLAAQGGRTRGGSHGFDPADPSMAAIFLARGPAFQRGRVLPAFDNVHVYPLLARLLGLTPAPNDGDARVLEPALAGPTAAATPALQRPR
jgi:predicted AlkP superfamily pyrophosphatase or phosphodiesterase